MVSDDGGYQRYSAWSGLIGLPRNGGQNKNKIINFNFIFFLTPKFLLHFMFVALCFVLISLTGFELTTHSLILRLM
jgi:hypothetical protein